MVHLVKAQGRGFDPPTPSLLPTFREEAGICVCVSPALLASLLSPLSSQFLSYQVKSINKEGQTAPGTSSPWWSFPWRCGAGPRASGSQAVLSPPTAP